MLKSILVVMLLWSTAAKAFIPPGIYQRVQQAVVKLYQGQARTGTGFYVRHASTKKSVLVTAAHVCFQARQLSPRHKPMPVLAINYRADVCVLDPGSAGDGVAHLYMSSRAPEHGDPLLAVGFVGSGKYMANDSRLLGSVRPHTYKLFTERSMFKSNKFCPGAVEVALGLRMCLVTMIDVIDITPTLQSGMSGGPTVNSSGLVVGVNALQDQQYNIGSISLLNETRETVNAAVRKKE